MTVRFEIWALDVGNLVAEYETEAAALADVTAFIAVSGRESVAQWSLARNGERAEDFAIVAEGAELADRAMREEGR